MSGMYLLLKLTELIFRKVRYYIICKVLFKSKVQMIILHFELHHLKAKYIITGNTNINSFKKKLAVARLGYFAKMLVLYLL